jgi:hypothetical protein
MGRGRGHSNYMRHSMGGGEGGHSNNTQNSWGGGHDIVTK